MIARIAHGIAEAQVSISRGNPPEIRKIHSQKEDYVVGPTTINGTLDHIMGPRQYDFLTTCKDMIVEKLRAILAPRGSFHCQESQMCMLFRVRRF